MDDGNQITVVIGWEKILKCLPSLNPYWKKKDYYSIIIIFVVFSFILSLFKSPPEYYASGDNIYGPYTNTLEPDHYFASVFLTAEKDLTLKVCFDVVEPEGKSIWLYVLDDKNYKIAVTGGKLKIGGIGMDYSVLHFDIFSKGCDNIELIEKGKY